MTRVNSTVTTSSGENYPITLALPARLASQRGRDGVLVGVSASPVMRPPLSIRHARSDYGKDRSAGSKDRSRPKQVRRIRSEMLQNEPGPDKPEYPDDSNG